MTNDEKKASIERYIRAYNSFDVEGMLSDLHNDINFKNISNGEVTLETQGIDAFKNQAELAVNIFSERKQQIEKMVFSDDECEVDIDYKGKLAIDLPNGLKTGETIELKGKSIFRFDGNSKIIEIQDVS